MRLKFAFGLASDDLFFVTTRQQEPMRPGLPVKSMISTFPHEDEFLELLIKASLLEEDTTRLALAVLLSIAKPTTPPEWTEVELTQRQMELLQLNVFDARDVYPFTPDRSGPYLDAARSGSLPQFYDLLMQAPAAIATLVGSQHRFAFLNTPYVKLMGVRSVSRILGKTVVEAYPELEGQQVIDILDRVYKTGNAWTGTERPFSFYRELSDSFEKGYYNCIFQPIMNASGEVAGIMVQATDVTEMVLARSVQESRERLLYRQWAELESIYRSAPIGLLLLDVKGFNILRLNERQAELMGGSVRELVGRPLLQVLRHLPELEELFGRVILGESVTNHILEEERVPMSGTRRYWLVNYAPMYSGDGKVDGITAASVEISEETRAEMQISGGIQVMV